MATATPCSRWRCSISQGRAGPRNPDEAARLLAAAAKLGHAAAAYDLGLLYLQGQQFPQDFKRAAELFRQAADAGNPEAQYALATMYKEGRGVPKDLNEADAADGARLRRRQYRRHGRIRHRAVQRHRSRQGRSAAAKLLLIAARRGSAIAQDRLARILMAGRGMPADATEAVKWHIIAKAGGDSDPDLDAFAAKQTQQVRDAAEKAAKKWMSTLPPRS